MYLHLSMYVLIIRDASPRGYRKRWRCCKTLLIDKSSRNYAVRLQMSHRPVSAVCQSLSRLHCFAALWSVQIPPRRLLAFGVPRKERKFSSNQNQQFHGSCEAWISAFIHGCFRLSLTREMLVQGRNEIWFRMGKFAFCLLELLWSQFRPLDGAFEHLYIYLHADILIDHSKGKARRENIESLSLVISDRPPPAIYQIQDSLVALLNH